MTITDQESPTLQEAFDELLTRAEHPSADVLEEVVARYPQHAAALTDFAIEWLAQDLLDGEDAAATVPDGAVQRTMELFQARLGQLDAAGGVLVDPFAQRSSEELTEIGHSLSLDKSLMAKLRDRRIEGETVPEDLVGQLAVALAVSAAAVNAHLGAQARFYPGANYKAEQKPEAGPKETFAEAVENSSLDDEAKQRWLDACAG